VLQYLLKAIKNYKTNILAIQETRWPNYGSIKKENKTIFYNGKMDGRHENRVGFVMSKDILSNVKGFKAVCYATSK